MSHAFELLRALRAAVREECAGEAVGVLFSGGLDSAVLSMLASEAVPMRLYTIGTPGSADLQAARSTAEEHGWDWTPLQMGREDIVSALAPMADVLGTDSPLVLSFEMPLWVVAQRASERLLISGQGADELFGGYARYARMTEDQLRASLDQDIRGLLTVGSGREKALAAHLGKEIRHPYLHRDVLSAAQGIPVSELVSEGERKRVLREVALLLGMREEAARPKKAAQYGSGVMKEMKAEARGRGVPLSRLVPSLRGETL